MKQKQSSLQMYQVNPTAPYNAYLNLCKITGQK